MRGQDGLVRGQEGGEELVGPARGQDGHQGVKRVGRAYRGANRENGRPRGAIKGKVWRQGAKRTG